MNRTAATVLVGFALSVSAFSSSAVAATNAPGAGTNLSGTIAISGSTALLPLVKDAAAVYTQQRPNVKINVSGGGSGTGINQVAAKAVDIGDSDIPAPNHPELVDHRVAVVGFAVVAHPADGVKNLTRQQLRDIFSGKATDWSQVGGAHQKIVVVNRPGSSGTRAVFTKTIMGTTPITTSGLTEDATGTVVTTVAQTPGAVSYAALSGVHGKSGLVEVSVDGIAPTPANIETGKYPIWSYEHMFTNGRPKPVVADFIAFVSHRNDLIVKNGFLPVSAMNVKATDR